MPVLIDPKSQNDFLYIHVSGKLTDDDYKKSFLPELKKIIDVHGHVNALVEAEQNFSGWTLHAMWDDAHFGWLHRKDFRRIAFVGDVSFMEYGAKLANWFVSGEVKAYKPDQLNEAMVFAQG